MTITKLHNGRVVIYRHRDFLQWCAWREWLAREVQRGFWPDKICVWGEWPPESLHGAQAVVEAIKATRAHPNVQSDTPVCDPPEPWTRWDFSYRTMLSEKHRADEYWNPPLPEFRGNSNVRTLHSALNLE
jgi:hypothetical protein